jgi:hypothetical protein
VGSRNVSGSIAPLAEYSTSSSVVALGLFALGMTGAVLFGVGFAMLLNDKRSARECGVDGESVGRRSASGRGPSLIICGAVLVIASSAVSWLTYFV